MGPAEKKFIRVPHTHCVSAVLICCVVVHFALQHINSYAFLAHRKGFILASYSFCTRFLCSGVYLLSFWLFCIVLRPKFVLWMIFARVWGIRYPF